MSWTIIRISAFVTAFVGTVAIWSSYLIDHGADPGRIARLRFTYIHIPVVAGIILVSASDEFLLAHPTGHASTEAAIALLGGPALFLSGALWLKGASSGGPP